MAIKKVKSQADFDAMYMSMVLADALVKVQNKYNLDVQDFLTTCFSTKRIAEDYFSYNVEQHWWFDEHAIEDILYMYKIHGLSPKSVSVRYPEDALYWIGYLLGHWFSKFSSQTPDVILPYLDIERLVVMYPAYHTLDIEEAVRCIRGDKEILTE